MCSRLCPGSPHADVQTGAPATSCTAESAAAFVSACLLEGGSAARSPPCADSNLSTVVGRLHNFTALLWRNIGAGHRGTGVEVVVAGGGPTGLLSGLHAMEAGAAVTVIEKRPEYQRSIWFDLVPASADPTAVGLPRLEALGFHALGLPAVVDKPTGVVTVQCHLLERFLALALALAGGRLRYGQRFVTAAPDPATGRWAVRVQAAAAGTQPAAAAEANGSATTFGTPGTWLVADLLIGADGGGSTVRGLTGAEWTRPNRFGLPGGGGGDTIERPAAELEQVTLIAAFEIDRATGECPALARYPPPPPPPGEQGGTGGDVDSAEPAVLDPFEPAFSINGVRTCSPKHPPEPSTRNPTPLNP